MKTPPLTDQQKIKFAGFQNSNHALEGIMENRDEIKLWQRLRAISKKIRHQFPASPEGRLMFSVVEAAIFDLASNEHRRSAAMYLLAEIPHASLCGVSSGWIRRVIKDGGVDINCSPVREVENESINGGVRA